MKRQFLPLVRNLFLTFSFVVSLNAFSADTEKRYYFVSSADLPAGDVECVDYRPNGTTRTVTVRDEGPERLTLIQNTEYDYLYFDKPAGFWWCGFDFRSSAGAVDLSDINGDWYLHLKVKYTEPAQDLTLFLYDSKNPTEENKSKYNLPLSDRTVEGWNEITLPVKDFLKDSGVGMGTYTLDFSVPYDGICFLVQGGCSNDGEMVVAIDDMYFTNAGGEIVDPEPGEGEEPKPEPENPAEKRYYIVSGKELPNDETIYSVDYRIGNTLTLTPNQMTLNTDYDYLHFDKPSASWWSFDSKVAGGKTMDFSDVDATWTLEFKLKTNVTHNPVNVIFFNGGAQFKYELNANNFSDRSGENFVEMSVPLSEFSGAAIPFPCSYSAGSQFFTLHADGTGNGSNFVIAMDDVYLRKVYEQESTGWDSASLDGEVLLMVKDNVLRLEKLQQVSGLRIFDISGKLLQQEIVSGDSFEMTLDAPKGIYFIQLQLSNGMDKTIKFLL